jgi:hypothetical protein
MAIHLIITAKEKVDAALLTELQHLGVTVSSSLEELGIVLGSVSEINFDNTLQQIQNLTPVLGVEIENELSVGPPDTDIY